MMHAFHDTSWRAYVHRVDSQSQVTYWPRYSVLCLEQSRKLVEATPSESAAASGQRGTLHASSFARSLGNAGDCVATILNPTLGNSCPGNQPQFTPSPPTALQRIRVWPIHGYIPRDCRVCDCTLPRLFHVRIQYRLTAHTLYLNCLKTVIALTFATIHWSFIDL